MVHNLNSRIESLDLEIGIVGLGYVGLPTAIAFFEAGFSVSAIDKNPDVVSDISSGRSPISDPSVIGKLPKLGKGWKVTSSFSDSIPYCDVIIVTVPTPVSELYHLDNSHVIQAGKSIFSNLQPERGSIVVLESTVYPGLTRESWVPQALEMGLEIGNEVNIAYCPERHNPGDPENQITNTSRIVGSMDPEVGKSLVRLYQKITQGHVKFVGEIEIAESSKLIENVQRDINIALVNELSMILPGLGIDIEDVLDAAETKWNFHRYTPGIGVGGHCIPVDPYFLIDKAHSINYDAQLISAARAINNQMPEYVSSEIIKILDSHNIFGSNRSVLILGWAYKPGIGDIRGSPSEQLARKLHENGIKVFCHDNYVNSSEIPNFVNHVGELSEITNIGLIALSTAHDEYVNLNWGELFTESENHIIFDGRRVLDTQSIMDSGWTIYAIGRPNKLV